jgi:hypothetical protein
LNHLNKIITYSKWKFRFGWICIIIYIIYHGEIIYLIYFQTFAQFGHLKVENLVQIIILRKYRCQVVRVFLLKTFNAITCLKTFGSWLDMESHKHIFYLDHKVLKNWKREALNLELSNITFSFFFSPKLNSQDHIRILSLPELFFSNNKPLPIIGSPIEPGSCLYTLLNLSLSQQNRINAQSVTKHRKPSIFIYDQILN